MLAEYLAGQRRPRPPTSPNWAAWGRPLLAAATVLPLVAMMIHLDPRCTFTDPEGNVTVSADTEAPTGWGWAFGSIGTTTSDGSGTRSCTSDTTQPWEGILSITVSAAVIGLASRWPTAAGLEAPADRRDQPQRQEV